MSPAAATRKYYKGRIGPMLGAHTSLTFTRKYLHRPSKFLFYFLLLIRQNIKAKAPPQDSSTLAQPGRDQMAEEAVDNNSSTAHPAQHHWKWLWLTPGKQQHAEMQADGS